MFKYEQVIVIGSGVLAVNICSLFKDLNYKISLYENKISEVSSVKKLCEKKDINYKSLLKEEITNTLNDIQEKTLIVSAVNIYLFPKSVVSKPNLTIINYHNGDLKKHRGMNVEAWTIYEMDDKSTVTWHFVNEEIDKGYVIDKEEIDMDKEETSISLLQKQSEVAMKLFKKNIEGILNGDICGTNNQDIFGKLHLIKDVPNNGELLPSWDMKKIDAFLRAMDYGMLYTLGKPYINYNGKKYVWRRYKRINLDQNSEEDMLEICDKNIVIKKKGSKTQIQLTNLSEM